MARKANADPSKQKAPRKRAAFSVALITDDKTYRASADTIVEAVEKLKRPAIFKGKSVLRVKAGKMSSEMPCYPYFLRRLFINPISREIFQKRMAAALK